MDSIPQVKLEYDEADLAKFQEGRQICKECYTNSTEFPWILRSRYYALEMVRHPNWAELQSEVDMICVPEPYKCINSASSGFWTLMSKLCPTLEYGRVALPYIDTYYPDGASHLLPLDTVQCMVVGFRIDRVGTEKAKQTESFKAWKKKNPSYYSPSSSKFEDDSIYHVMSDSSSPTSAEDNYRSACAFVYPSDPPPAPRPHLLWLQNFLLREAPVAETPRDLLVCDESKSLDMNMEYSSDSASASVPEEQQKNFTYFDLVISVLDNLVLSKEHFGQISNMFGSNQLIRSYEELLRARGPDGVPTERVVINNSFLGSSRLTGSGLETAVQFHNREGVRAMAAAEGGYVQRFIDMTGQLPLCGLTVTVEECMIHGLPETLTRLERTHYVYMTGKTNPYLIFSPDMQVEMHPDADDESGHPDMSLWPRFILRRSHL